MNSFNTPLRVIVACLLLCSAAWAHPPEHLLVVHYQAVEDELHLVADISYDMLYPIQRREGGSLTKKDFPTIARVFDLDCPLQINSKPVSPKVRRIEAPNETWGRHYLDHALPEAEIRIARITLVYRLPKAPSGDAITVQWGLFPPEQSTVKVRCSQADRVKRFEVTRSHPEFVWDLTSQQTKE
ncbi:MULTISPECIES: hypothetical protein [unclassified Lentimonas]|uniref:hypothetical protein n=1 Tax=unclassified Lentimonas TaxID=2630993 RepID=UPI00132BF517|nr:MULTISPECIES: hypothetical protein [unclassified Lentimonas]CAA6676783.1 Unannotated [Lentimonas sp. CC4]CAA6684551.1 Unannotated [Lentimonas sp. CC6]CAA6694135.1 Unannotated [Lentimonas sp. CC10]CAA6694365.1 Unannotated [Lentimonas sp. CC19]CAA7071105.1 Unannotated [Lentimonas sp. CC11]